jgi:hypothetical protein
MVFKKDITPIGKKGTVTKHKGKGAVEQRRDRGGRETLTRGDPLGGNRYPKPKPAPPAPVAPPAPAVPPMGMGVGPSPSPMPSMLPPIDKV